MTETLTHIAMRQLNIKSRSDVFKLLPNFKISQDARKCLIVEHTDFNAPILTNDIIDIIDDKNFIWNGRADNVINSGGVKLIPEAMEKEFSKYYDMRFFISSLPHNDLGEEVILVIESDAAVKDYVVRILNQLNWKIKPKKIFFLENFEYTSTGKIDRALTKNKILKKHKTS